MCFQKRQSVSHDIVEIRILSKPLVLVVSRQRQIDAEENSSFILQLGQRINSLWKQNRKIYPHPQIETVENSKEIAEAEFIIPPGCSIWVEDGPLIC